VLHIVRMRRHHLLPLVTLGLLFLVLADRALEATKRHLAAAEPVVSATSSATPNLGAGVPGSARVAARPSRSAAGEARLARLAAREALTREAGSTYLDSLILSTDSVVRRWPDRWGSPIRVAIIEGGVPNWSPKLAGYVRTSLDRWESLGIGLRFDVVSDTSKADILVRWIDHFDFDRAGQTDLTWDQSGRVRRALVSLALRTNAGVTLPDDALLSVAVHETGHAIGLPHSADSNDVMYPATRTGILSDRDRRTAAVLYRLPPGPVRDITDEKP
jgi:matrixin